MFAPLCPIVGWKAADSQPIEVAPRIPFKFRAERVVWSTWHADAGDRHTQSAFERNCKKTFMDNVKLAVVDGHSDRPPPLIVRLCVL